MEIDWLARGPPLCYVALSIKKNGESSQAFFVFSAEQRPSRETDQVLDRVIGLVKKFDKIDSSNKASVIVHVSLHSKIDICQGL